jgi:CDP-glucose 4,6-dehydratase
VNLFDSLGQKRILITGHTGFKGSWLSKYLEHVGAEVFGFSLPPEESSLYASIRGLDREHEHLGDINDFVEFRDFVKRVNPDLVIHMAAQSLVRKSYVEPIATYQTNVMGTINVMHASLESENIKGLIAITTDKVYENNEAGVPFREDDPKGGHDPYSGSKAAMEIAVDSWRYFYKQVSVGLVSARAGNVIGYGDRSKDRLLPDIIRSLKANKKIEIRNPASIRPWQHVLEPLTGYLIIASRLISQKELSKSYNLGPASQSHLSVMQVAKEANKAWGRDEEIWIQNSESPLPEAMNLMLDSDLAGIDLNWRSKLTAAEAVALTIEGELLAENTTADEVLNSQISRYLEAL